MEGADEVVEDVVGDPLGLWEVGFGGFPAGATRWAEAEFRAACAGQGVAEVRWIRWVRWGCFLVMDIVLASWRGGPGSNMYFPYKS